MHIQNNFQNDMKNIVHKNRIYKVLRKLFDWDLKRQLFQLF